jgi:outer membrane protein assembly factor BamB
MPNDVSASSSGGIAYEDGRLFVSTSFAQLIALDAKTGTVLWRQHLSAPMRGAPAVRAGRVIVVTVDDHTYCLASDDGQTLWTHQGTVETASLLAGNSPAIDGNTVVVPYASGELFALRIENGSVLWQDSVANVGKTQGVATLTDITGRPIIDRGRVYVMGHADVLAALDLRTGKRLWDRDIGGIQSPWVAGDFLFLITNNNELIAVDSKTGDLIWVTQLQTWEDQEKKKDRIVWTGPILASNRLIIASNTGILASVSPYTGAILGQMDIGDGISVPPVVANHGLFIYTDEADVLAYK